METRQSRPISNISRVSAREWLCYRSTYNDINSKVFIKQSFMDESRANTKKLHFNKKNPTKRSRYYRDIQQQAHRTGPLIDAESVQDHIFQTSLPNAITYTHEGLGSRIYNCKFTTDGQNILVTSQNGTSFFKFADNGHVELSKVISCMNINWTITDSDISSDNRFMVHSTLSPNIHMFDVQKAKYCGQFNLSAGNINDNDEDDYYGYSWSYRTRIYSVKLAENNQELIVGCGRIGTTAPVQVFDLETKQVKSKIAAHSDDVNSVCYLDRKNSSIFISGSDDGLCKIWDTRILKDNQPVGIFYGHISGLTCVNSKEDNRYFISNSKDQTLKLWDIRNSSTEKKNVQMLQHDYRYSMVNQSSLELLRNSAKKQDQSIMTFKGHNVHTTLIRCHFSPLYGTGQRYVYSGSYDGKVFIYDTVTGDNIMKLQLPNEGNYFHESVCRDCAWHPYSQSIITTSFIGEIHKWEYVDLRESEQLETQPIYSRLISEYVQRNEENQSVSEDGDEEEFKPEESIDSESCSDLA